nr:putative ribonuclease H-like domain-containing protein [Tanacetum cinerariifolium]
MGYEKPSTKLTFYKAFLSAQWKFLIHIILHCMSAKRTAWIEFSSSMASAVICLATVDDLSFHNTKYTSLSLTQKVFANMRRIGKGFSGVDTPLFDGGGGISKLDADKDVTLVDTEEDVNVDVQGRLAESQARPAKVDELIEVVIAAKLMKEVVTTTATTITAAQVTKASAQSRRRGVVIQDPEETATTSVIVHSEVKQLEAELNANINWDDVMEQVKTREKQDNTAMRYQALKRKPVTEAQERTNMMIYLKNMVEFKMDFDGFKHSEHPTPAKNLRRDIPKSRGHRHSWNRKACFVCKSLTYLIKDCDYYEKKMVQKPGNPYHALKDKGVIDSGCSRHMTWNISYLSDFEELNRGYVAFGRNPKGGKITGKDTECIVLSSDFKLSDENHVLLRVPRENNMYNIDLKNIVPSGDLTCLFAKATLDEFNIWHRRLGHINFKTMNKLVKGNLVRGLPSKVFENNNTCVAYKKSKQHRAFCQSKPVSSVSQPLQRVLVTKPHNKAPYELLLGRTPTIGFIRPFGYPVTILNTLDPLGKFDGKADEGFLVGYSVSSKAFSVFNSRTRIVHETLHINFLENQPNVTGSGPTWVFDIDTLTQFINYQPVVTGNQLNSSVGIQETLNAGTVRKEAKFVQQYMLLPLWSSGSKDPQNTNAAAYKVKEPEYEFHVSPSSSDKTKKHDEKTKREAKGKSHVELSIGVRDLSDDFEEFSDNNTNRVNASSTPVTTVGRNSTYNTNTFSAAGPSNTVVSLTFGLDGKSSFMDPSQYPDDPYMPALEDITYSEDEADFSNLETNITISLIPTTKVQKDHLVTQIIGDLSSAPQTRSMTRMVKEQGGLNQINDEDFYTCIFACFLSQEEPKRVHQTLKDPSWIEAMQEELLQFKTQKVWVLVDLPKGFKDPDYPDKVYKVVKALYGLHQALRAWYETFANYLLKNGFQRGKIDQTLFIKKQRGDILLVWVYVDDIIFGSTNKELCKAFEKLMKDKFQMSSMGELTFFGIITNTPIDTKKSLLKDPDGEDVDVHTYRSMIGSLMYLTSSRSDIMFTVCACSRFQVTPKASYLHAVKRIFRYLKGMPHLGSWYPKDSLFNLVAYSDSNYARASLDRKSTTGGFQFLGCILISWQCKKQTVVATSSTKAKYVAVATCCAQVLWIQNQLLDYGNEALAILRQMKTGKENSNPLMADRLPKTILLTFIHGICINMNVEDAAEDEDATSEVSAEPTSPLPTPTTPPPPPQPEHIPSPPQAKTAQPSPPL